MSLIIMFAYVWVCIVGITSGSSLPRHYDTSDDVDDADGNNEVKTVLCSNKNVM